MFSEPIYRAQGDIQFSIAPNTLQGKTMGLQKALNQDPEDSNLISFCCILLKYHVPGYWGAGCGTEHFKKVCCKRNSTEVRQ